MRHIAILLLAGLLPAIAAAEGPQFTVKDAYAFATIPGANVGVGFATLCNESKTDNGVIAARSSVAESLELHDHVMDGEVMQMRKVERIDIPAGECVALKPGGLHLMLIGMNTPLVAGKSFMVELGLDSAHTVQSEFTVRQRN